MAEEESHLDGRAMSVCAFTSVCEEDACWVDQYLAESRRLNLPFAIHLDRCSVDTRKRFYKCRLCIGMTQNKNPLREFTEQHKQGVFDIVVKRGFDWAMAWDIDETYERDAPEKLLTLSKSAADYQTVTWVNLWEDKQHIRTDGPFYFSKRVKFYRINNGISWFFDHKITNGAKPVQGERVTLAHSNLVCLHWGLMTEELRLLHNDRWDRIYTKAVGANPYGFWQYTLDKSITPTIVEHDYF